MSAPKVKPAAKPAETVQVCLRCRPLNSKERADKRAYIVKMVGKDGTVTLTNPKVKEEAKVFTFDDVFDWNCTQEGIYNVTCNRIVEAVVGGYNGTVFAYGQTGTGKTFTMEGVQGDPVLKGMIPRTFEHVFDAVNSGTAAGGMKFLVRASYLEIYNENIRDLLMKDPKKLELKEDPESGVYVKDQKTFVVNNVQEIEKVFAAGTKNRTVGATLMNQDSSRSHSIFTIIVESSDPEGKMAMGKLNLVDLAGSERQSKTGATGDRLKEATKINMSLSALGNVIKALVDRKQKHIPYRDSKLTRLLQDSLGGNAKTVMIANMGPADYNFDETLNTLRYADRAKNIKNKPKVNEDPKDAMLREFQDEISALKAKLANGGGTVEEKVVIQKVGMTEDELNEEKARLRAEFEKASEEDTAAKAKLEEEMNNKVKQMEAEKRERDAIELKLKKLESRVMSGGENMLDKVAQEKAAQRRLQAEMEEQRRQEAMLKARMEEADDLMMEKEKSYSSLEDELKDLDRKLAKGRKKIATHEREVRDLTEEFTREKVELEETVKELDKNFKFKQLVLAHYIPEEHLNQIETTAQYDPVHDEWLLLRLNFAGNAIRIKYPERYADTMEGDEEAPEPPPGQRAAMAQDYLNHAMNVYAAGGMSEEELIITKMNAAADLQAGQGEPSPYHSYEDVVAYQEDPLTGEPLEAGAKTKSKSRAKSTKAKFKAAAQAAQMASSVSKDKGSSSSSSSKSRSKSARPKTAKSSRPKTASRRREGDKKVRSSKDSGPSKGEELYPEAKGTVQTKKRFA